ncbi:DUF3570 domain-containing protein [Halobacteriovorax sp. JY17]|uniref:DUF3570 domain-containing protein n=1 Tax=Halobacteriovorax sp. JY17 TaxID=2014617 RepID=UPI000C6926F7|nr:DUF3570 domain-containing protein [Halobacteriovorax sp. JY17]PIK13973.1 MAG: hypothetical protein CES88_13395 [Halobacteriovorax sp. JY17]
MDVTKLKKLALSLFLVITSIQSVFAEMMEKGQTKFKLLFNLYHQNSDDGEQVFDNSKREEANVVEPMLFIEHQITEDTAINAHFVFDFWTAASDTKLDGLTGASGGEPIKGQSRVSGTVGARKEIGDWAFNGGLGFSSEYDYRSLNASLGVERSLAKDNFTIGLGLQYYSDEVRLFEDLTPAGSATISEFKPRKILAASLTASQILTRKDIIQFGLTYIQAKDNLESTASSVLVSDIRESEKLPDSRKRYAASSKWVHGFSDTFAMNLFYRYYFDQWRLDAHTVRLAFLKEINDDEDFLEFSIRLHSQDKVRYYQDSFNTSQDFMTSDSDLDKFNSYELSMYLSSNFEGKKLFGMELDDFTWNNGVTGYKRSNGLIYAYFQSSLGFEF